MFNLNANEEYVLKYWSDNKILEKARQKNKGKKPFYFLDGPPYASGDLHPGQIWVKSVKDILVRYRRMKGLDVHDRAGFDVHGLPIENKIEKLLELKSKKEIEEKVGVENFVNECRKYVDSLIPKMTADFRRFGSSLDFDSAYLAYRNEFIESAWSMLKSIHKKGLLYTEPKPMLFCPHCETVLAQGGAEVVYSDEKDPSIFVAFKIDPRASKAGISADRETYLVIWTTTPWTLPSNIAVAVNPKERYVIVSAKSMHLIIAKQRLDAVMSALGENAVVESEFYGSELEGIRYVSPLEEKIPKQAEFRKFHKVVMAESLVSLEEGSGLVHIAPGHGAEDYVIGKKNNLPIFSPVNMQAVYTEEAGSYSGLKVPGEANAAVLADLKVNGSLLDEGHITHSYPHCWRCNSKLILINTKQWFLNVQKLKKKLISENKKVLWHPGEAQAWFEDVLQGSPDWSIARQRYWGIPVPIWECGKCGSTHVVGSLEELSSLSLDSAKVASMQDLHRPYIDSVVLKCSTCGSEMKRIKDVFDVWFDSGIAFRSSLSDDEFKNMFPADFILEGKDQLRGWFSTLLKTSVMVYGKAPYKNVVIDGMLLAEDGREMHKSWGNYIALSELLKITSADAYRLWCSNHTQWLDLQFKKAEIKEAEKKINTLYNIFNLFQDYSSAAGYVPKRVKKPVIKEDSNLEDKWILSRLASVAAEVDSALQGYTVQRANKSLGDFLLNDLSRFYLKIAKRRIAYGTKADSRRTLDIINYIMYNVITLMTPFAPLTTEYLYLNNYAGYDRAPESISLCGWPKIPGKLMNNEIEQQFKVADSALSAILNSREKSGVKLRWPILTATIEVISPQAENDLQRMSGIMEEYANVKKIIVKRVESFSTDIRPNFSAIGPEFKEKSNAVSEALKSANAAELSDAISRSGYYELHTTAGTVRITPQHFTTIEKLTKENSVKFDYGIAYIEPKLDAGLMEEAIIREFERRVQVLRKNHGLKKADKILLHYTASPELSRIISSNSAKIRADVGAKSIDNSAGEGATEFDIEGETAVISLERV